VTYRGYTSSIEGMGVEGMGVEGEGMSSKRLGADSRQIQE
jgi:hypothetical protein